ncbi:hypothetical protein KFE98_16765 [bacterium SCSIO 12741]|nr:hypothetical protein KFE98_16765 [bacterium SCSIO 12741]
MSKRELNKYLDTLSHEQMKEQVLDLYGRFKEVKEFYNFVFNPKEDKLLEDARFKISKEYFPISSRRPKARRSVAQKLIKHFIRLGVDPLVVGDLMLYNLEIAQSYSATRFIRQDSFFTSMLRSFDEALSYLLEHGLRDEFEDRIQDIVKQSFEQNWFNRGAFEQLAGKSE